MNAFGFYPAKGCWILPKAASIDKVLFGCRKLCTVLEIPYTEILGHDHTKGHAGDTSKLLNALMSAPGMDKGGSMAPIGQGGSTKAHVDQAAKKDLKSPAVRPVEPADVASLERPHSRGDATHARPKSREDAGVSRPRYVRLDFFLCVSHAHARTYAKGHMYSLCARTNGGHCMTK